MEKKKMMKNKFTRNDFEDLDRNPHQREKIQAKLDWFRMALQTEDDESEEKIEWLRNQFYAIWGNDERESSSQTSITDTTNSTTTSDVDLPKNPLLVESPLPLNVIIPKGKRGKNCLRTCLDTNVTKTGCLAKQERLMREKNLKRPVIQEEEEEEEKIRPCLDSNITKMAFMSKQERLRREKKLKRPMIDDEEEEEETIRPKKKMKKVIIKKNTKIPEPNKPPPEELMELMKKMGGSDLGLVIQKTLYRTDVNPQQGRLSIPISQIKTEFLTEEEKNRLTMNSEIEVLLIEPCLKRSIDLKLRKWNMKTSSNYVLVSKWSSVVKRNQLCKDMTVQLWSFRDVDSKLCLALVEVKEKPNF